MQSARATSLATGAVAKATARVRMAAETARRRWKPQRSSEVLDIFNVKPRGGRRRGNSEQHIFNRIPEAAQSGGRVQRCFPHDELQLYLPGNSREVPMATVNPAAGGGAARSRQQCPQGTTLEPSSPGIRRVLRRR